MKYLDFRQSLLDQDIKFYKKMSTQILLYMTAILMVIVFLGYSIYQNPTNITNSICLGSMIANFIYTYAMWKMNMMDIKAAKDHKTQLTAFDDSNLEKTEQIFELKQRMQNIEIVANAVADENKKLKSKLQEAETSSYKCPATSNPQPDVQDTQLESGYTETQAQTVFA